MAIQKIISKIYSAEVLVIGMVLALMFSIGVATENSDATTAPLHLRIPSIGVNALVEPVGLTALGAMDTPKNIINVAWLSSGSQPGEIGTSVIAGHFGWKDQKQSAFDNLHNLKTGEIIYVDNEQGETISFTVREIKLLDPTTDTTNVFSSKDKLAHLNLITCGGAWDAPSKNYTKRLVIFSEKLN